MTKVLFAAIFAVILASAALVLLRLQMILDPKRKKYTRYGSKSAAHSTHILIVLGSGGHTAEMIAMLERAVAEKDSKLRLEWTDFTHRTWVVSSGDAISAQRAKQFEDNLLAASPSSASKTGTSTICTVPRARKIHQPLYTAPFSSLQCLWACLLVLTKRMDGQSNFPDLVLCNGPATATIMILASILLRLCDFGKANSHGKMRTVYVESWARVKKLSLSGTLLSYLVDRFLVQWPQLVRAGGRAEYMGVLV